jgi:hypothetical protein
MEKIAFVSGFYCFGGNRLNDDARFMYECLYNTAKKYFLPNHNVEFIFVTNCMTSIDGVTNIHIKKNLRGYNEMLLMKILCVDYLKDSYDYIFVNDGDQIFVDYVGDELLENDFNVVKHFFTPKIKGVLENMTQFVKIDGDIDTNEWTMGNFFGGKSDEFLNLLKKTKEYHNKYKDMYDPHNGFYSKFPDEVFLAKYYVEEGRKFNWLNTTHIPNTEKGDFFLSDYQDDVNFYPNFTNVKLLHNTKKNFDTLRQIIKYYI